MINGTTVIKAKDTASAMEKVVRELGEDCVILSTKKVNGQVSITASNSKKAKDAVKKRYDKKKFANIYKLNSILETALKINKGHKNIEVNKVPNNIKNEIKVIKINSDLEKYLKSNL